MSWHKYWSCILLRWSCHSVRPREPQQTAASASLNVKTVTFVALSARNSFLVCLSRRPASIHVGRCGSSQAMAVRPRSESLCCFVCGPAVRSHFPFRCFPIIFVPSKMWAAPGKTQLGYLMKTSAASPRVLAIGCRGVGDKVHQAHAALPLSRCGSPDARQRLCTAVIFPNISPVAVLCRASTHTKLFSG